MVNTDIIRGKMAEKKLTQEDMSKFLKMTPKTFRDRLSKRVFDSDEILIISRLLEITDDEFMSVFFAEDVAY